MVVFLCLLRKIDVILFIFFSMCEFIFVNLLHWKLRKLVQLAYTENQYIEVNTIVSLHFVDNVSSGHVLQIAPLSLNGFWMNVTVKSLKWKRDNTVPLKLQMVSKVRQQLNSWDTETLEELQSHWSLRMSCPVLCQSHQSCFSIIGRLIHRLSSISLQARPGARC